MPAKGELHGLQCIKCQEQENLEHQLKQLRLRQFHIKEKFDTKDRLDSMVKAEEKLSSHIKQGKWKPSTERRLTKVRVSISEIKETFSGITPGEQFLYDNVHKPIGQLKQEIENIRKGHPRCSSCTILVGKGHECDQYTYNSDLEIICLTCADQAGMSYIGKVNT